MIRNLNRSQEKELLLEEINNIRTLYRREIEEATPQQIFQAVSYAVKEIQDVNYKTRIETS